MTSQCGNFDTEWPGTWVVCVHRKDVLFFEQVIKPIIETCKKKIDQITKKLSSSDFFYGWPFGTWFLLIHSHHVRDGDWKKILEKHVFIIKSGKTYKSMHIEKLHTVCSTTLLSISALYYTINIVSFLYQSKIR